MDARIEKMERDSDGFWVHLKKGWKVHGEHSIVEDTKKAALAKVKDILPCTCKECSE